MSETLLLITNFLIVIALSAYGWVSFRRKEAPRKVEIEYDPSVPEDIERSLRAIEGRMDQLELGWGTTLELLKASKEAADGQWQKIRSSQSNSKQPEEEDDGDELPLFDGGGGEEDGVYPLHTPVGDEPTLVEAARRAVVFGGRGR